MKFEKYCTKLYLVLIMFVCINCLTIENVFSEDMKGPDNNAVSVSERSSKTIEEKVLNIWKLELWSIDDHVVTVKKVVSSLLILFLGILLIKSISWLIKKRLSSNPSIDKNTASLIQKIIYYFLVVFLLLFALRILNIPLTAFTFLGGALAIGIGFGTQTIMSNFISGFILLAERPIRVGDLIEVDNTRAKRIKQLIKLLINVCVPKPIPIARAPPKKAKAVRGILRIRKANKITKTTRK